MTTTGLHTQPTNTAPSNAASTNPPPPNATPADRLAAIFPVADATSLRRARRVRFGVAGVTIVALLGSGIAVRASASSSPRYRTATVGTHDIASIVTGVATVEAVAQATVAFPIAGTVADVDVKVGDRVDIGATLATLATDSLDQTLHARQADLAQAELTLSTALSATTTSTSTPTPAPSSTGDAILVAAKQAVLDAQQAVDLALGASAAALDSAGSVCDDSGTAPAACRTALTDVRTAQQATADAQQRLATTSTDLDGLLATSVATPTTVATTIPSTGARSTSTPSSSTPSAERLAAYQRAVDAAGADVIVATHARSQAVVTAPVAGTVVAVGFAAGDAVTADSSTQAVTIVGDGGYEVTTTVPVDRVTSLAVGQRATVRLDGSDAERQGDVVRISTTPTSSSSTTYRVTVSLAAATSDADDLHNGATGTVSIVTKATTRALAVPTSAVTASADGHTVRLRTVAGTKVVNVGVGIVGSVWTEITSGLTAGQRVVLADLDAALPGSAAATSAATSTAGTAGGGLAFPGGFPSGPPPNG